MIAAFAPGSVSNVCCGFDVLGMSLSDPADEMIMSLSNTPGIHIIHEDEYGLPEEPEKNVAGVALLEMLKHLDASTGFTLRVRIFMDLFIG